ncbi:autophagy-related protein 11 domain-containing protein [Ditylenchus destructor]|nr:autophagy-related protein 11 domain-containing protein [Ditylenchus destructor]
MFHIFYVNKGYMLVLEPPALGSVYDLQQCIYESTSVEIQEQVLFLSGGESVASGAMLSSYLGAGTDTNPVYLVRRVTNADRENVNTPEKDGINNLYQNWISGVEKIDKTSASSAISAEYAKLGKYGIQLADMIFKFCAKVVSEHQHLNQGWMAVISNLDDNINRIQKRMDRSMHQSERLATIRDKGKELLNGFDQVLNTLNTIVIPGHLLSSSQAPMSPQNELSDSGGSVEDMTLYDWISSKDPIYSLNVLVEHVMSHLQKTDDTDLRDAKLNFEAVKDLVKKTDYRDIRGIDKRLAMLDTKLRSLEENHIIMKDIANHIVQPTIQDTITNVVTFQRARVEEFSKILTEFYNYALCFIDSKLELLKNISQRFAGWVRQAYERLQQANKRMILFDDKFTGLRQRLDLVRQIKEAPIMYVTAVAEVIRREALQKEFGQWISVYIEKCSRFVTEENKIRTEFFGKLDKHFLRQLFYGMSDQLPNFAPEEVKIDRNMPKVTVGHLRDLRKSFPDMQELLKVTTPQVYNRLSALDPNMSIGQQSQMGGLRRDESFFVREKTTNIDAMNRNFPSTTWLSEENIDMSPASNFLITRHGFSSNSSLNTVESNIATPSELEPLHEFGAVPIEPTHQQPSRSSMSPMKSSAPIQIPNNGQSSIHKESGSHHSGQSSSHFGTPDDNFGSFGSKYMRNSFPRSPPKLIRPQSLQTTGRIRGNGHDDQLVEGLELYQHSFEEFFNKCAATHQRIKDFSSVFYMSLSQSVEEYQRSLKEETVQNLEAIKSAWEEQQQNNANRYNEIKAECDSLLKEKCDELETKCESVRKELSEVVEHERYLRKEKEMELDEQKALARKLNDDLLSVMKAKDDLHVDLLKAEQERRQLAEQLELESSIDYLSIELKAVEQLLKRELTPDEVQQIKAEIEKRRAVKSEEETSQASTEQLQPDAAVRAEYEKAYKNKMEFIIKGVEEKKNKEIATVREEIENEKQRIAELEDKVRFFESAEPTPMPNSVARIMVDSALQVYPDAVMQESCMILPHADMDQSIAFQLKEPPEEPRPATTWTSQTEAESTTGTVVQQLQQSSGTSSKASEDSDVEVANVLSTHSRGTQTRIRSRDMRMMIALTDVYEGCSVLIMWDNAHSTYVVFCTSPTLHFVKESCMLRLGVIPISSIGESNAAPRRNWMFAVVTSVETCQIRKEKNRYNLPMNTRFYRVSVEPLPMDMPSSQSSNSISTSKR